MKRFLCTLLPAYRQLHSAWRRMVRYGPTLLALGAALLLPADRNIGVDAHALPFYSQPFGNNRWRPANGRPLMASWWTGAPFRLVTAPAAAKNSWREHCRTPSPIRT
jgi:hypothetical protein